MRVHRRDSNELSRSIADQEARIKPTANAEANLNDGSRNGTQNSAFAYESIFSVTERKLAENCKKCHEHHRRGYPDWQQRALCDVQNIKDTKKLQDYAINNRDENRGEKGVPD
tara:strand:- start:7427 stop:7765 length:339 start_codon:yes stop_codon:yes gene_type:complete